jgi:hypothetical protein
LSRVSEAFKTDASEITNLALFVISIWPLAIAAISLVIYLKRSKFLEKVQNAQTSSRQVEMHKTTKSRFGDYRKIKDISTLNFFLLCNFISWQKRNLLFLPVLA